MKKIVFLAMVTSLALTSQSAISAENASGCGIGQKVMEGESGTGAHIGAWILNQMILPQSSSITSGILGCDASKQVNNDQQKETFVASNINSLSVDMAQGEGEHLTTLAALMGVAEDDQAKFFELTQKSYSSIFSTPKTNANMMLSALNHEMTLNPDLAAYVQ